MNFDGFSFLFIFDILHMNSQFIELKKICSAGPIRYCLFSIVTAADSGSSAVRAVSLLEQIRIGCQCIIIIEFYPPLPPLIYTRSVWCVFQCF